ncbi:MAG: HK97 gp10 family phage protein [Gemmatimonadaceae bacterium]
MAGYKQSFKGVGDMLKADFMVAEMRRRAELVKVEAEATAPVGGAGDPTPGSFKAAFKVAAEVRRGRKPRAVGRVTNDDPVALQIETGTRDTPRHATLRKALKAAR